MALQKNTASQKWIVFAFNRTDSVPKIGDALNITAKIAKDWGAAAALGDVNPIEIEDGFYQFDLTQVETNANVLHILPQSATADIQVIGVPGVDFTRPAGFSDNLTLTAVQVNAEVDSALNTVVPASPVANSINERLKTLDDNYTTTRAVKLDNLDATMSSRATTANQTTILNRLGDYGGTGLNTVKGFLQALFRSDAGVTGANVPSEINEIENAVTGTYDGATDGIEAIRNRGDAAWTTAVGFSTLTAAQVNTEVDNALNTAIPASPVADSINERVKTVDDNYTITRAGNLDNLDAAITTRGTLANQTTILNRLGNFAGSGLNTVKGFFQALFRSDGGVTGANVPSEINEIENTVTGTYDGATDSVEAIRNRGDVSWVTAAGFSTLTEAQVNTQADLALADYDGPTNTEMVAAFTEIKGATWAVTDTLEAIRDRGDVAWITAAGFSTHTAANVWTSVTRTLTAATNITSDGVAINTTAGVVNSVTTVATTTTNTDMVAAPTTLLTTQMAESYAADGVAPTLAQSLFMVWAALAEFSISTTVITAKKLDGVTTAMTFTLDDATSPTSRTRAT